MPVDLITAAHFSVSACRKRAKLSAEPPTASIPSAAKRSLVSAESRTREISLLRVAITSAGVPAGDTIPFHALPTTLSYPAAPLAGGAVGRQLAAGEIGQDERQQAEQHIDLPADGVHGGRAAALIRHIE